MPEKSAFTTNQSTAKALAILELIACSRSPLRLKDICDALGINKSTALRFLSSLTESGYILQEETGLRYYPSFKLCRLAGHISANYELRSIAHPTLETLSEELGESVCLSVERDMVMVYADVVSRTNSSLMSVQRIGNISPMHCTGNGKLLLTAYSEEQLDRLIAEKGLPAFTAHTLTDKAALQRELAVIRREGVAYDREECEIGLSCIACPLRDYTGEIVAGISVTGPTSRIHGEAAAHMQQRLSAAAARISEALGYETPILIKAD